MTNRRVRRALLVVGIGAGLAYAPSALDVAQAATCSPVGSAQVCTINSQSSGRRTVGAYVVSDSNVYAVVVDCQNPDTYLVDQTGASNTFNQVELTNQLGSTLCP